MTFEDINLAPKIEKKMENYPIKKKKKEKERNGYISRDDFFFFALSSNQLFTLILDLNFAI